MSQKMVKTWDIPTRLFHWLLVVLIANAYLTYEFGDVNMKWHMWNGYALLTLVIYRLFWGVFGSSTARFTDFIKGPGAVISYIKSMHSPNPEKHLGHNPVGALMVLALLGLILLQGSMGLFTSDDIFVEGPLTHKVSSSFVDTAGSIHRIGFWVIVTFAGLHIAAALFYLFVKKENLIRAMVTGKKPAETVPEGSELKARTPLLALLFLGVAAAIVWYVVTP